MTTIVYKDGILAADTLVTYQGMRFGKVSKIFTLANYFIGAAGSIAAIVEFKKFIQDMDFDKDIFTKKDHESDFIVIDRDTDEVSFYTQDLILEPIKAQYYSIGSGSHFAYGALAMGATAKEACEAASKFDYLTNNIIQTINCNV